MLQAVIMDVDGTMYRQAPVRRAMLWRLLRAHAAAPLRGISTLRMLAAYRRAQEELRWPSRTGLLACPPYIPAELSPLSSRQLRMACNRTGENESVVARCVARWMEEEPLSLLARARYPHLLEFLETARARGIRLAALSDYDPVRKLKALGVSRFFDLAACATDPEIQSFKPDPRGLQVVMRKLDISAGRALYIGDRLEVDARAAERAGMPCAIIGQTGDAAANLVPASNYKELCSFIAKD